MCLRQAALGIADCALTIVGTYLKSGGLAKISGVSLELSSGTLNMEATRRQMSALTSVKAAGRSNYSK